MRVFRFWQDIALPTSFNASFALIEPREIDDEHGLFDEIVSAIKKTDCKWVMIEHSKTRTSTSEGLSENEILNHRAKTR